MKPESTSQKQSLKNIFPYTIPVLAGYVFLGIAFGLLLRTKGYPWWLPILMSLIIYSGSMEYAAIPILAEAFNPISSFVLGVMLSARHLFYGIPMLDKYKNTGKWKVPLIAMLTDETFSILSTTPAPDGITPLSFYQGVSCLDYAYWVGGTAIGAIFGGLITFDLTGIDFALTALFIVLFIESLKDRSGLISGFIGLIASAVVLAVFGSSTFVIFSMIAIAVILLAGKKVIHRD